MAAQRPCCTRLKAKPMQRASFKKMQVGVNLFMKPLARALDEEPGAEAPTADPSITPTKRRRWF